MRSQSLPVAPARGQRSYVSRLVRSASPRRRVHENDAGATARTLGLVLAVIVVTSSPAFVFLVCAAAPVSAFAAHVMGTLAWAILIGRAEAHAFAGLFLGAEVLGISLGVAGVLVLPFVADNASVTILFGVLAAGHVALLDYSRRALEGLLHRRRIEPEP